MEWLAGALQPGGAIFGWLAGAKVQTSKNIDNVLRPPEDASTTMCTTFLKHHSR